MYPRFLVCLPILFTFTAHAFAEEGAEKDIQTDDLESCVVAQLDAEPGASVESTWTVNQDVVFRTDSACEVVNVSECSIIKTWTESMATPVGECQRTCTTEFCNHTGLLMCLGLPPVEMYTMSTESTTCTDCEEIPG